MRKRGIDFRLLLWLALLVLVAGGVALVSIGGTSPRTASAQAKAANFDAEGVLSPETAAPAIALHNYKGEPVNIDAYRGKAVFVTFLYTNCPDICPLITSNLRVAQNMMGKAVASKAQIIAVSVDPKGDTPQAVANFLARHGMSGRMQYLVGSAKELARVWAAWGVGSERDAQQPQFINHSGVIYGITGSGKRLTVYSASFRPEQIAHDVPLLADR